MNARRHIDRLSEAIKMAPEPINIVRVVTTHANSGGRVDHGAAVYRMDLGKSLQPIARWHAFVAGPYTSHQRATESAREYARKHPRHWLFQGRAFGVIDESIAETITRTLEEHPGGTK